MCILKQNNEYEEIIEFKENGGALRSFRISGLCRYGNQKHFQEEKEEEDLVFFFYFI